MLAARSDQPNADVSKGWLRVWQLSAGGRWIHAHRWSAGGTTVSAIALIAAVQFTFVTLPARQAEALSRAESHAGQQKAADDLAGAEGLDACLATAQGAHRVAWDQACRDRRTKADCTLPGPQATLLDEQHRQVRAECIKRHSIR